LGFEIANVTWAFEIANKNWALSSHKILIMLCMHDMFCVDAFVDA
jgi:hypothetical protein